ncbi:hypothetical protein NQ318_002643 [Aromia moschata]|uniref:Uncharacterized protein n=1 Tax=Aromia moschata TaxID=1265417 RepID=A0AAV8Y9U0_9CUCU|nr:hypothetical protein NQ318_002643 [Aromia moschata]
MFEEIAKEMQLLTKSRITATNCENRWKVGEEKTFEYAEIMHSILGGKRNINPVLLLSSETITIGEPSENIMEVVQEDSEGDPRHEEDQNFKIASTSVIKTKDCETS